MALVSLQLKEKSFLVDYAQNSMCLHLNIQISELHSSVLVGYVQQ